MPDADPRRSAASRPLGRAQLADLRKLSALTKAVGGKTVSAHGVTIHFPRPATLPPASASSAGRQGRAAATPARRQRGATTTTSEPVQPQGAPSQPRTSRQRRSARRLLAFREQHSRAAAHLQMVRVRAAFQRMRTDVCAARDRAATTSSRVVLARLRGLLRRGWEAEQCAQRAACGTSAHPACSAHLRRSGRDAPGGDTISGDQGGGPASIPGPESGRPGRPKDGGTCADQERGEKRVARSPTQLSPSGAGSAGVCGGQWEGAAAVLGGGIHCRRCACHGNCQCGLWPAWIGGKDLCVHRHSRVPCMGL